MRLLHALLLPTLPLVLATPALAEEPTVSTTEGKLILTDRSNPPPVRPSSETLEFAAAAPDGFPALPAGLTGVAYGTVDVRGASVPVAVASSAEGTEDRVVLDADGDGTFGADEVLSPEFGERGETRGTTLRDQSLAVGGGELVHKISGWRKPTDFLAELATAEDAVNARSEPPPDGEAE